MGKCGNGAHAGERTPLLPLKRQRQRSIWYCDIKIILALLGVLVMMIWLRRSVIAGLMTMSEPATAQNTAKELLPFALAPLPLGSIKPAGWMKDQLHLMADGFAGRSFNFYRFIKESPWLGGGQEYAILNEAFPYWYNAIVPLAYSLDDDRLKAQVKAATKQVIDRQAEDGWLGPEVDGARNLWARFPVILGMVGLLEADPEANNETVLPAIYKYIDLQYRMLKDGGKGYLVTPGDTIPEGDHVWGRVRYADMIISLQWLYEHAPEGRAGMLLESMQMLFEMSHDWAVWYKDDLYIKEDLSLVPVDVQERVSMYLHGVNTGQGMKAGAVVNRFTPNDTQVTAAHRAVDWTFQYRGSASGSILADERLKGLGPMYGSELCTTVETMYSLAYLYQALGDTKFAEHAEMAAYNALPGANSPDWWAHQYVSTPNQPYSQKLDENPFWNVNNVGTTFGLEPNYPCCTVNHPQGYPKFLANSWMTLGQDGIVHGLLGPSSVSTKIGGLDVKIKCETNYPFGGRLDYTVETTGPISVYVRVPEWAGAKPSSESNVPPGLSRFPVKAGTTSFSVNLDASIRHEPRANDTMAVHAGALLYALMPSSNTTSAPAVPFNGDHPFTSAQPAEAKDYTIVNTSPWNIAIDPKSLVLREDDVESLANPIWKAGAPPSHVQGKGCEIDWPIWKGGPGPVPNKVERKCTGPVIDVRLVPYGSAKVHMAELPTIDL